jgi:hypothetical protein
MRRPRPRSAPLQRLPTAGPWVLPAATLDPLKDSPGPQWGGAITGGTAAITSGDRPGGALWQRIARRRAPRAAAPRHRCGARRARGAHQVAWEMGRPAVAAAGGVGLRGWQAERWRLGSWALRGRRAPRSLSKRSRAGGGQKSLVQVQALRRARRATIAPAKRHSRRAAWGWDAGGVAGRRGACGCVGEAGARGGAAAGGGLVRPALMFPSRC